MTESNNMDESLTLKYFNERNLQHTWSSFMCSGPSHMPTFQVYLILNNTKYEGYGTSKKRAKISAIQNFISNFNEIRPSTASKNGDVKPLTVSNTVKFTKRELEDDCKEIERSPILKQSKMDVVPQTSAISILHEIFPEQNFVYEHDPPHGLLESISVLVFGKKYVGYGQNKKEAKEIACRNALKAIYEVQPIDDKFKYQIEIIRTDYKDAKIIDYFAHLTNIVYQQLEFGNIKVKEYSVIASILKVTNNDINTAEVICLATGTKCLNGNSLSLNGESLNDCHAEVLARRCLVKYFYQELLKSTINSPSIFTYDEKSHRFSISNNISFHLYINTAPCGEARIFSFSDTEHSSNRLNRGLLRSKIENGAGTVSVIGREIQTYDGIAQGERLITMSCSDKLTRWNVLGLQGNLLSNIVDPIYLKSISIGSVFNNTHMKRAMYERIEKVILNLPEGYKMHKPELRGYSVLPRRLGAQSPYCINWIINEGMELLVGNNGRTIDNQLSRLCKSQLAKEYINLFHATNNLSTITKNGDKIYYDLLKNTSVDYLAAKQSLISAFKLSKYGTWIQKPEEITTFELNINS